jgi:hypothetical protein
MSSTLTVTKQLTASGWTITASLNGGASIPREIFVYENSGTNQLGAYYGVLNANDLNRIQIFIGSAIPAFGNNFVRYATANIVVRQGDDPEIVITMLKTSVQKFSTDFQGIQNSTQVFTIT